MRTTGIRDWADVMHVACPPHRTPTPTIPPQRSGPTRPEDGR